MIFKKHSAKFILIEILKRLGEASLGIIDEGFLNPGYSFTHPTRLLLGLPVYQVLKRKEQKRRKRFFSLLLYRLKKEGLVVKTETKGGIMWRITAKGENALKTYDEHFTTSALPPEDGRIRLVSFDVPENERWKRDRLREVLVLCGYSLLHQSLWIGKRPLSQDTLKLIKTLKLLNYIHIFEISKKGTIKKS